MPSPTSAIVVGGGIAGASISRVLAARGVRVKLLEKSGQLCSGATWHAAGLVTRFGGSPKIKKIHVDAVDKLTELHEAHDIGLHLTGSIRIVEKGNADRYKEAMQHLSMASLYDNPEYPTRMIGPDEILERHPLIDLADVECGLWTPSDGDVDPTTLTNCVARLAKENGAEINLNREVVRVRRRPGVGGGFVVTTADGNEEEADVLINAAGLWSKQISTMVDPSLESHHKCYVIEHQYAITEELPSLKRLAAEGKRVPVLRDLKGSSYIRQERTGLLVGPYESECAVRNYDDGRGEWITGPPSDWGHELFPDRLDRIEENLLSAMELIPELGEVGITSCVNGPTIWTGDSLARVGKTHIDGAYEFNTLTYGIAQSLPLAEYLGGMILDGEAPFDATSDFDPLRYGSWCGRAFTEKKIAETYTSNNAVSYPFENRRGGREHVVALSSSSSSSSVDGEIVHPLLSRLVANGAHTTFSNSGLEVPAFFFDGDEDPLRDTLNERKMDAHDWIDRVDREAQAVLGGSALSYASFSKFRVVGEDAEEFLARATTAAIPKKIGRTKLTYACTPSGKVFAEFSVCKIDEGEYYLVGSRDYAAHDAAWLGSVRLREDAFGLERASSADVSVSNVSDEVQILHVAGPDSHRQLSKVCPEISDVPFLQMRPVEMAGHVVQCFRVSFTGCLGYELHCAADAVADVYDCLRSHPATASMPFFGGYAQNSLRIEKGFKLRGDLDYAHYTEAGIAPFVSTKKACGFIGKDEKNAYVRKRESSVFVVQTGVGFEWSVPSDTPIRRYGGDGEDKIVGFTTSAAKGAVRGTTVALGYVHADANGELAATPNEDDEELYLEAYGQRWPVTLLDKPPVPVSGRVIEESSPTAGRRLGEAGM